MKRRYGLAGLAVASLVLAASAAAETKLAGTVGPGFTITLRTTDGADVMAAAGAESEPADAPAAGVDDAAEAAETAEDGTVEK